MEETISRKEIFDVLKKGLGMIVGLIIGAAIISYFIITSIYDVKDV